MRRRQLRPLLAGRGAAPSPTAAGGSAQCPLPTPERCPRGRCPRPRRQLPLPRRPPPAPPRGRAVPARRRAAKGGAARRPAPAAWRAGLEPPAPPGWWCPPPACCCSASGEPRACAPLRRTAGAGAGRRGLGPRPTTPEQPRPPTVCCFAKSRLPATRRIQAASPHVPAPAGRSGPFSPARTALARPPLHPRPAPRPTAAAGPPRAESCGARAPPSARGGGGGPRSRSVGGAPAATGRRPLRPSERRRLRLRAGRSRRLRPPRPAGSAARGRRPPSPHSPAPAPPQSVPAPVRPPAGR